VCSGWRHDGQRRWYALDACELHGPTNSYTAPVRKLLGEPGRLLVGVHIGGPTRTICDCRLMVWSAT